MNTVNLIGNCTRPAELTFAASGTAIAKLGIAINKRVKEGDEWVDGEPSFYNITAFGSLAENIAETVEKGMRIVVVGRIEQHSWTTDEGEKRSAYDVLADECSPSLRWASATVARNERSNEG